MLEPAAETGPDRSLVAWVSGLVLAMLLYLCFATIFSIVRPVRRLLAATRKLARGENARVVASGGIRELDTLTLAFNSMAEQLAVARAAARDAQQRLEAKVEERTQQLQELAEQDPLTGIANRRQLFGSLSLEDRQCTHFSVLHVWQNTGHRRDDVIDLAAKNVRKGGSQSAVGNVDGLNARRIV